MKKINVFLSLMLIIFLFSGCVDQKAGKALDKESSKNIENPRVIASSMSTVMIMEKLNVDLIAIPNSDICQAPGKYKDLPKIGMAMSPDLELMESLNPDYVFGPVSLIADLLPKYEAAGLNYGFLNLNNTEGMYRSIADLGKLLNREKEANELIVDYENFMNQYKDEVKDKPKKKVLLLMGLPGSYVVATENSYAGSLVELAGGENVYAGTNKQFLNVNTEDMLKKEPDMILRTAHAMPEEVMEMFKDEFAENDIWKHFDCVKKGEVYDLDYSKFGMSANFKYKEALNDLKEVLYGE